jgi:hypothetical protein
MKRNTINKKMIDYNYSYLTLGIQRHNLERSDPCLANCLQSAHADLQILLCTNLLIFLHF